METHIGFVGVIAVTKNPFAPTALGQAIRNLVGAMQLKLRAGQNKVSGSRESIN